MPESTDFRKTLEAFLASDAFSTVVHDDMGQLPVVPRVVALHRDGRYTVYSRRDEAEAAPDALVLEIPPHGDIAAVRDALRRSLPRDE
jgi:hypothetical protein